MIKKEDIKFYGLPVLVVAVLIFFDQFTKKMALLHLKPIYNIEFIKGFMDFTFVENYGVAFGMFSGHRSFILLTTISIMIGLCIYYVRLPKIAEYRLVRISLVLVLSGAIGNMIDRFFLGYVVDFFEFTFISYPVFNVADIYVVVGVLILSYCMLFVIKEEEEIKEKKDE